MSAEYEEKLNEAGGWGLIFDIAGEGFNKLKKSAEDFRQSQDEQNKLAIEGTQAIVETIGKQAVKNYLTRAKDPYSDLGIGGETNRNKAFAIGGAVFGNGLAKAGTEGVLSYMAKSKLMDVNEAKYTGISDKQMLALDSVIGGLAIKVGNSTSVLTRLAESNELSGKELATAAQAIVHQLNVTGGDPDQAVDQLLAKLKGTSKSQRSTLINSEYSTWKEKDKKRIEQEGILGSFFRNVTEMFERAASNIASILVDSEAGAISPGGTSKKSSLTGSRTNYAGEVVSTFTTRASPDVGGDITPQLKNKDAAEAEGNAVEDAAKNAGDATKNFAQEQDGLFAGMSDSLAGLGAQFTDTFVNGVATGKMSFKDFANSVIQDIGRIIAKKLILKMIDGIFGGFTGGGASAATSVPSANGGGFTGTGARSGGLDGKGGFMALLHPNETIIDHTKGGQLPSTGVNVVVNNFSSEKASAKETTDSRGKRRIEVTVGEMVAGEIKRAGSAANGAIRQTFGVSPALVGR